MSISIKLEGDWGKLKSFAIAMPRVTSRSNKIAMMRIGLEAEKKLVKHIQQQDLNWEGLKDETVARKRKDGKSGKTLIRTSQYFQAISSDADNLTAIAGVKRGEKYNGGEDIADIARIHEYGSERNNIPARPLYQPTQIEMRNWIKLNRPLPTAFMEELKKKVRFK